MLKQLTPRVFAATITTIVLLSVGIHALALVEPNSLLWAPVGAALTITSLVVVLGK